MNTVNPQTGSNDEVGEIHIVSVDGRLGRVRYIAYNFVILLAAMLISTLVSAASTQFPANLIPSLVSIIGFLVYAILFVVGTLITIQRLHDFNASGWLWLLTLVPIVNFFFAIALFVIPGTRGRNRFGPRPRRNSLSVILVALLAPLLLLALIYEFPPPSYEHFSLKWYSHSQPQPRPRNGQFM